MMLFRIVIVFLLLVALLGFGYYGFKGLPGNQKLFVLKWATRLAVLALVSGAVLTLIVQLF